ncbi:MULTISPECIES: ATP-dependent RecD-like DNA helicase [Peptoniphilus]|uniref:SF1B family DNA helicase RecD2 n=1 Tax=Peptoniphilus TaxID=162289 RepID=UPI0001DCA5D1|nr:MULTISPECIES: ATP-dependent RecD-like DNA helicase [Peptoniphilus]EFK39645.1 helicase, RecD/TraA family [Peptoniphilus sp. oral taxon 836 str. F0141]MDK8281579.1 ATP-dependent RecD-like DNA helicase [Peptoniphilus lacrimalis]
MINIDGIVEKIIFRNDENGYTVAKFLSEDESIVVVGSCFEIFEDRSYKLKGDFTYHKKFGQQFAFTSIEEILPNSKEALIKYLSNGMIPFVGEKVARKIVEEFGENTLEILEKNPQRLLSIEGIGRKKYKKIYEALEKNLNARKILLYFSSYNISPNLALKIYKEYGDKSIDVIKENPYVLIEDIGGIGFKKADQIALSFGIKKDSEERIIQGLKYVLSRANLNGHTYLPLDILVKNANKLLEISIDDLENSLRGLSFSKDFYVDKVGGDYLCYYAPYLRAENYIAGKLNEINITFHEDLDVNKKIEEIEETRNIKLANGQRQAIKKSLDHGVFLITGGPGTGKTTALKALIDVYEFMGKKIKLAAPTGRAAKRMKESTGHDALTLHKLLEINFTDSKDIYYDPIDLECDVLIVDEMSMVDIMLMETLLRSLEKGVRLILVGDPDQLPSVGAGNVLRDIIDSKLFSQVNLVEIFRQKEESMIIKNAHLINKGERPILNNNDFFLISEQGENKGLEIIKDLLSKRLGEYYGIDSSDIQVLSPMKKGLLGTFNLNKVLQELLNKSQEKIEVFGKTFKLYDRVIQMKNNYDLEAIIENDFYKETTKGVFNGDLGYISSIDVEEKILEVTFDDAKKVKYLPEDLDQLELSYAMTIHKSQGSEFPVVVIPLFWAPPMLLTRNLIYTAITRASKLVVLVGKYEYLMKMIENNKTRIRYSNLKNKLIEANEKVI